MKKILVLGATGHLGRVLVDHLLKNNYSVVALVRNPDKIKKLDKNLTIIKGSVTDQRDLKEALEEVEVVISTLGHGFRTSYPIQEKTLEALIPLMEEGRIKRFITITGAGLIVNGDPPSLIGKFSELLLSFIDPYRMNDAKRQQSLLEKSRLDWTVVRTPIHSDRAGQEISHIGYQQPRPWSTISRKTIAEFMIKCLEEKIYIQKSPIIF